MIFLNERGTNLTSLKFSFWNKKIVSVFPHPILEHCDIVCAYFGTIGFDGRDVL